MAAPRSRPTRPEDRYGRVDTALRAVRELSLGRRSVAELARVLGTSERSAYRLMHAIERSGIRLHVFRARSRVWYSVRQEDVLRWLGVPDPAAAQRDYRRLRKAAGLCQRCRKRAADPPGSGTCSTCRAAANRQRLERKAGVRRRQRCSVCGSATHNKRTCPERVAK